jgi:hypothetical protein
VNFWRRKSIRITAPVASKTNIIADIEGVPLWFSSTEAALRPSAESFGSALWLPALESGRNLSLAAPADEMWLANMGKVAALAEEWWGYAPRRIESEGVRRAHDAKPGFALCFTGGVDSFYSLLAGSPAPNALVFVHGYDITLQDTARWRQAERGFLAIAEHFGMRPITVRSNLREHPVFRIPWDIAHGGALAALGHALADEYGTLIISSTHANHDLRPWGSHWRLDPLWSASDMRIEHRGAELTREKKLRAIASHPMVRKHLRVCWEYRNERLNCGHCDKCLVAMVILYAAGQLDQFATFEAGADLPARLDALSATVYQHIYPRMLRDGTPEPVAGAIRRLLARSGISEQSFDATSTRP